MKRVVPIVCVVVAFLAVAGCRYNKVTGGKQFNLYSYESQREMGQKSLPAIINQFNGMYADDRVQAFVNEIGQSIAANSHEPEWKFEFRVLNSGILNAFALPGGFCFVTRGLLMKLDSEAEIAAVLGHEVTHVTAEHGATRISRGTVLSAPIGMLGEDSLLGAAGAGLANLYLMKYGREQESQCDSVGLDYMVKAGWDPGGMLGTLKVLDKASGSKDPGFIAEMFSSHPMTKNRITDVQAKIKKEYADLKPEDVSRGMGVDRFQTGLADMLSRRDSWEVYDYGMTLMRKGAELSGKGDAAGAKTQYQAALSQFQNAERGLQGHAVAPLATGTARFALKEFRAAEEKFMGAARLDSTLWKAHFLLGRSRFEQGNFDGARSALNDAEKALPGTVPVAFFFGMLEEVANNREKATAHYQQVVEATGGKGEYGQYAKAKLVEWGVLSAPQPGHASGGAAQPGQAGAAESKGGGKYQDLFDKVKKALKKYRGGK